MERPHHGTVSGAGTQLCHIRDHFLFRDIGTGFFSKIGRYLSHLQRHGGIIRAQIRMALARIDNHQAVVLGPEVKINFLHNRFLRILKINRDQSAHRAGHLV